MQCRSLPQLRFVDHLRRLPKPLREAGQRHLRCHLPGLSNQPWRPVRFAKCANSARLSLADSDRACMRLHAIADCTDSDPALDANDSSLNATHIVFDVNLPEGGLNLQFTCEGDLSANASTAARVQWISAANCVSNYRVAFEVRRLSALSICG